jgi:hypothetical protein
MLIRGSVCPQTVLHCKILVYFPSPTTHTQTRCEQEVNVIFYCLWLVTEEKSLNVCLLVYVSLGWSFERVEVKLQVFVSSALSPKRKIFIFLIGIVGGGIQMGPLSTAATNRPTVPTPCDYVNEEIGGMMIGRGNRSTRRKSVPVPLCPPQIPHSARTRTRTAAVGGQRLTA